MEVARLVSLTNQRLYGKTLHRQLGTLLRDIAGNLFRRVVIDPAWLAWNDLERLNQALQEFHTAFAPVRQAAHKSAR